MLMENYLAGVLFIFNIFGGLCGDPEKTPDSSEPGEQTGEAFVEPIELAVYSLTLELKGQFSPGSAFLVSTFEALQVLFRMCSETSYFPVKGPVYL